MSKLRKVCIASWYSTGSSFSNILHAISKINGDATLKILVLSKK